MAVGLQEGELQKRMRHSSAGEFTSWCQGDIAVHQAWLALLHWTSDTVMSTHSNTVDDLSPVRKNLTEGNRTLQPSVGAGGLKLMLTNNSSD